MSENEIHEICEEYGIKNYTINDDMSIDVDDKVELYGKYLTAIPLKFRNVNGFFDCYDNSVTSLEGCPVYTAGDFICTSNKLISLSGLPVNFYIGGDFYYGDNAITEAKEFGKLFFGTIRGTINVGNLPVLYEFLNNNRNPPKKDLPRLLSELRKIQL